MLSCKIFKTGFSIILLFSGICLHAQIISGDSLEQKVQLYNKAHFNSALYLTTDKTLYLPTEVIWFTGYVLDGVAIPDSLRPDILSVALVGEDAIIKLRKNYFISNNICLGSLSLPDSVVPGNYQLIAYTNIVNPNGKPMHIFSTPVTIKSATTPSFTINFALSDKSNSDSLFVDAQVYLPDGRLAAGKGNNSIQYYLLDKKPGKAPLNSSGIVTLALSLSEVKNSNRILYTSTTFNGVTKDFNFHLPIQSPDSIRVKFYPEGGDLVTGLSNRVAWEATLPDSRTPAQVKALLLENDKVLDTLRTDSSGMGLFTLLPGSNCVYTVKTIKDSDSKTTVQTFTLPTSLQQGFVLEIPNAVADDTLCINLQASKAGSIHIAVVNMLTNTCILTPAIPIVKNKKILLPLDGIGKGLNILTLLNQQGLPVAERLFFSHFNKKAEVQILTDKIIYKPREKITADIMIADTGDKLLSSAITISCVHLNRLNTDPRRNIASYFYIEYWLDKNGTDKPIGNLYQNKSYLEKLLLVKGWRRYTWQSIIKANSNAIALPKKLHIEGSIQYANPKSGKIRKMKHVFVMQDSAINIITTNGQGIFYPKPAELVVAEDKEISLKAGGNNALDYVVLLPDPMKNITGGFYNPVTYNNTAQLTTAPQSSKQQQLTEMPFSQTLKTVIIKAKPTHYYAEGYNFTYGVNSCGDYVCRNNVLNCPNHRNEPDNKPAIQGEAYSDGSSGFKNIYKGCPFKKSNISGIYTAREFYGVDSSMLTNPNEGKSYLSTLFWEPLTIIPNDQKTTFHFYSSDLPGTYKITIEGIAGNGELLYQEKSFTVKKESD